MTAYIYFPIGSSKIVASILRHKLHWPLRVVNDPCSSRAILEVPNDDLRFRNIFFLLFEAASGIDVSPYKCT